MADNKELKPRSFRIDDETSEKFRQISSELQGNQQQTLSKLIEAFEFQKGKVVLVDKKKDIELFENYITVLTRMYMTSLEDNQNVTQTVKAQYDALLQSKETTIISLQSQINDYEQVAEQSKEELKKVIAELKLQKETKQYLEDKLQEDKENYESIIKDKDDINNALKDAYGTLKIDNSKMIAGQQELEKLQKSNIELEEQNNQLQDKINRLLLDQEKLLLNKEKEYNEQIKALEKEHKKEVETYQTRYLNLEKEHKQEVDKYQSRYMELEKGHKEEVDMYQAKYLDLLDKMQVKPKIIRAKKPTTQKTE